MPGNLVVGLCPQPFFQLLRPGEKKTYDILDLAQLNLGEDGVQSSESRGGIRLGELPLERATRDSFALPGGPRQRRKAVREKGPCGRVTSCPRFGRIPQPILLIDSREGIGEDGVPLFPPFGKGHGVGRIRKLQSLDPQAVR